MLAVGEKQSRFLDLGYTQKNKHGEYICGDSFQFRKSPDGRLLTAVLSDGLGSGVKANILSSLTATMALKFASEEQFAVIRAAETMMSALPVCQVRKISYATFTIVNASLDGTLRAIEMGNPRFLLFRNRKRQEMPSRELVSSRWADRKMTLSRFQLEIGDRFVFFSDGVSQAGIGTHACPLGWEENDCAEFIAELLERKPDISSHEICSEVVQEALRKEPGFVNADDMTCAALYLRHSREMLLFTGPPYDRKSDAECAGYLRDFGGDKVICGGTTAEIVSRELKRGLSTDLSDNDMELPPVSLMEGVTLVTEGVFTLSKAAGYLEHYDGSRHRNAAGELVDILLRNDIIDFLVGTRVNEAHQDPNLPLELELRRNIVARIANTLQEKFFKKINIKYV